MHACEPGKAGSGVIFWGDAWALREAHQMIHDLAGDSEYLLGLAYDFRKAYEGLRLKSTTSCWGDRKKIYGVEVNWIYALTQVGMLRPLAARRPTTAAIQAFIYMIEAKLEEAVREAFAGDAEAILKMMAYLGADPDPEAIHRRAKYLDACEGPLLRRTSVLPVLWSLDRNYDFRYMQGHPRFIDPREFDQPSSSSRTLARRMPRGPQQPSV